MNALRLIFEKTLVDTAALVEMFILLVGRLVLKSQTGLQRLFKNDMSKLVLVWIVAGLLFAFF